MRQLTNYLFESLKEIKGELHSLLEYVKADDTLDMEFRGDSITLYYRGGAILTVEVNPDDSFEWRELSKEYLLGCELSHRAKSYEDYIPEAKHIIDRYICDGPKNHLGEKEIQQLVVKENNYSPYSNDTDYFIVDMEFEEGKDGDGRFDLIALRWDSNVPSRRKDKVSLAVIEVKQGIKSVASSKSSPGLRKHQKDFSEFIQKKKKADTLSAFCDDMLMIFKQKCELGLIIGNDRTARMKVDDRLECSRKIDFICLLANYKAASSNLVAELMGKGIDDFMRPCKVIVSNYMGYGLYSANIIDFSSGIDDGSTYLDAEKRRQSLLYANELRNGEKSLFGNAKNFGGVWSRSLSKWYHYPYILRHEDSLYNLFSGIREDAIDYFERHDIAWWSQDSDRYFPTGNLVSSQNHCLNHLFAIRADKQAVLSIIQGVCPGIKDILPSPVDCYETKIVKGKSVPCDSYITFEFSLRNNYLLGERSDKRGKKCTSVDAFVYAIDQKEHPILIPIEWKYTESYDRISADKRAVQSSINRYVGLANMNSSNLKEWISSYEWDPLYEFARQELFMERIIQMHPKCGREHEPLAAEDYIHIIVRPDENELIRKDISDFRETIVDKEKLIEVDPKVLLAPLNGNVAYDELLKYLKKRYWGNVK